MKDGDWQGAGGENSSKTGYCSVGDWQARAGDRQVRAVQADESYRQASVRLRQEIGSWTGESKRLAEQSYRDRQVRAIVLQVRAGGREVKSWRLASEGCRHAGECWR